MSFNYFQTDTAGDTNNPKITIPLKNITIPQIQEKGTYYIEDINLINPTIGETIRLDKDANGNNVRYFKDVRLLLLFGGDFERDAV